MGLILDDHDMGVHAEARRESFTLYEDFGGEGGGIELLWDQLDEVLFLVKKLRSHAQQKGVKTCKQTSTTKSSTTTSKNS